MGYTHYWYIDENLKEIDNDTLEKIKLVCSFNGHLLDNNTFNLKEDLIDFNGIDDDAHETFFINLPMTKDNKFIQRHHKNKNLIFGCCKTAYKPYDIVVCSVLLLLKLQWKNKIRISSDGDFKDWLKARNLIYKLFGYEFTEKELFDRGE